MLYSSVALVAGTALLAAQDAHAFFIWWPFSRPLISPYAFTGCIKRTSTWSSIFTASAPDAGSCVANCARMSDMAYWSRSSRVCKCGNTPNALGFLDFSFQPYVSGNEGQCGSNYESYMMTNFGFLGCANNVDTGNAVTIASNSRMSSAFRACAAPEQVMVFKYGTPRRTRWSAYCFDPEAPPVVGDFDPVQCNGNNFYLYGNAPPVTKRGDKKRGAPDGLPAPWCPEGHTPCQIDDDESLGYECVDIENDGNQCGGCSIGVYGSNFTAPGDFCGDKATCAAGKCVPNSH